MILFLVNLANSTSLATKRWLPTEPSIFDCVVLTVEGQYFGWRTVPCKEMHHYLCIDDVKNSQKNKCKIEIHVFAPCKSVFVKYFK